jgi:acetaldehyde dehydrogenase (acetylating)
MLFGRTVPFDDSTLSTLYPGGKAEYLEKFKASLDIVTSAGFILAEDRAEILELVASSFPLVAVDS